MSRFIALLCLSVGACSHESRPAESAENSATGARMSAVDAAPPTTDPTLHPASLESSPGYDATKSSQAIAPQPAPRTSEHADAHAPLDAATTPANTNPGTPTAGSNDATRTYDSRTDASKPVQPDNTKVNERDRNSAALTPGDQSNADNDLKLTQQIRQAVMADKSLSFTAKNIKIIAKDGKVTLRGPVKTAEERAAIEADARKAAGSAPIDNQIEVKK